MEKMRLISRQRDRMQRRASEKRRRDHAASNCYPSESAGAQSGTAARFPLNNRCDVGEIRAWLAYEGKSLPLAYWRTSTGLEVDLVIGDLDLAIDFKASHKVDERDLKGLRALMEGQKVRQAAVVSQDSYIRRLPGNVTVYPWQRFCEKLWAGDLL